MDTPILRTGTASFEALDALRNVVKLGGSLFLTWGIALVVRILLPRALGPEAFGTLHFAEVFSATCFVALSLGVESYVRKEAELRAETAGEFFGALTVLRAMMSVGLMVAMQAFLFFTHRSADVKVAVFLFGVGQWAFFTNQTLSSLLPSAERIEGLSAVNVLSKLIWGGGMANAMLLHHGLWAYATSFLVSELIRGLALLAFARRHVGLRFTFKLDLTKDAVVQSAPFYLAALAQVLYAKLDVTLLSALSDDREVGFYGAASTLAGMALLLGPALTWALQPLFALALARGQTDYEHTLRRSLEWVVVMAIPLSLAVGLGADLWIRLFFGWDFAPAVTALQLLAPTFAFTFVAATVSTALQVSGRAASVTSVWLGATLFNALLNGALIPPAIRWLNRPGAGGIICALIFSLTGAAVVIALLRKAGKEAVDSQTYRTFGWSLLSCAVVAAFDFLIWPRLWGIGNALVRLWLDGCLYLALVVITGALRPKEMVAFTRDAARRSHEYLH